ncbi:DNA polymerase Y family protein [Homoserinimonas sp. OAct 916]|uniref:DNA polymerase Y family protein n=1 Tax=Homoserinimonas sp. OAct 916 TaxID=2211450 RepID=UPI000DBE0C25|nr:DNA polymerase Y family protein [Homoserinimonas sp. OAct 916]
MHRSPAQPADPGRTIVVWVPDWPVIAATTPSARRAEGDEAPLASAPVAVIEKGLVFACSAAARSAGIRRGLRLREAQARCVDLVTIANDQVLGLRRFEPIIMAVEQLMPGVQVIRAGMCAVRARGPVRFYGGEEKTAALLIERLRGAAGDADKDADKDASNGAGNDSRSESESGNDRNDRSDTTTVPDCRVGIADGLFAAEQAARSTTASAPVCIIPAGDSAGFLAPLPIAALGIPSLSALLPKLGMHTLGSFAALDQMQVRHRFGEAGSRAHTLARAAEKTAVVPRAVQKELDVQVDFEPSLDRADQIAFALRPVAERFTAQLAEQHRVCTAIRVRIDSEKSVSEQVWLHPRWFTAADVIDRVRWQVQPNSQGSSGSSGNSDNSDTGLGAVVRVTVSPETVDGAGNHEDGLWSTAPDERIHHGLARVQGILGHDAVLTAVIGGGRMLADRQLLVPWGDRPPAPGGSGPWPGRIPAPLPGSVFAPPLAARVVDAAGVSVGVDERGMLSAVPVRVQVAETLGSAKTLSPTEPVEIAAWAGPWPVDERWWDASAARSVNRFQVLDTTGCAWLLLESHRVWQAEARYD